MLTLSQCEQVLLAYSQNGYAEAGKLFMKFFRSPENNVPEWIDQAYLQISINADRLPDVTRARHIAAKLHQITEPLAGRSDQQTTA